MDLLDMPPEIFEKVTHNLVTCSSCRIAWRLRLVCRTFKTAIEHEMFARQPYQKFQSQRANTFLRHHIDLYLYYRSRYPLDMHTALPTKITQLVEYLGIKLHHSSPQQADITRQALCESISKVATSTSIIDMLLHGTLNGVGLMPDEPLHAAEKLFGAMFVAENNLVRIVLPSTSEWAKHALFGYPLVAAVALDQSSSVNMILNQNCGMFPGKRPFMSANESQAHLLALIQESIFTAITDDNIKMVHDLTCWYNTHVKIMSKSTYNDYMKAAIRADSVAMVDQILKVSFAKTHNTASITAAQEDLIFQLDRVEIMKMLVEKGHVKPRIRWLVDGVRYNRLNMARLMVQVGVDIDASYHRIPCYAVSSVEVSIFTNNMQALQWLLSAGATLPEKIDWRKERGVGRAINKAIREAQQTKEATSWKPWTK